MPSILNATTSTGLVTSADNSGSLQLATNNGTTAVTIDTSQRVGVGTDSPAQKLDVRGGSIVVDTASAGLNPTVFFDHNNFASGTRNYIQISRTTEGMVFGVANADRMTIDSSGNLAFNSGYGSVATAYGCRAWVNFNGTGTVAIRASGNVSSITDNGTGQYTVNFSNAMVDANYSAVAGGYFNTGNGNGASNVQIRRQAFTTTTVGIRCIGVDEFFDPELACVSIFR